MNNQPKCLFPTCENLTKWSSGYNKFNSYCSRSCSTKHRYLVHPEHKDINRNIMKNLWKGDDSFKQSHKNALNKHNIDPEFRKIADNSIVEFNIKSAKFKLEFKVDTEQELKFLNKFKSKTDIEIIPGYYVYDNKENQATGSRKYKLDFYLPKYKLCIEIDGLFHTGNQKIFDKERDRDLYFNYNIWTIRYDNKLIDNNDYLELIVNYIIQRCKEDFKLSIIDYDGTFTVGIIPMKNDIIITGRCIDEATEVLNIIHHKSSIGAVTYFNPIFLKDRGNHTEYSRTSAAVHKCNTITQLYQNSVEIEKIFEDDPLQIEIMKIRLPEKLHNKIIYVKSNTEK